MTHLFQADLPTLDYIPRDYPDFERLAIFMQYTNQFIRHCPKCYGILRYPSGGGVACVTKSCGYGRCY